MAGIVSIKFQHGLGDCAYAAHLLKLYLDRGFKVEVECPKDKQSLFRAAGCEIVEKATSRHPWPHSRNGDNKLWSGSKIAGNLSKSPLPDIGTIDDLWDELCAVKLSMASQITSDAETEINGFVNGLPRPLVLFHSTGNTAQHAKNLSNGQIQETYQEFLDETDATLILLDWDDRVPKIVDARIKHLGNDFKLLNVLELACLIGKSDLMIGVDSGPLHVARLTNALCLGIWTGHYPSHFTLPRNNSLHLVSGKHAEEDKQKRMAFNTALTQNITGKEIVKQSKRLLFPRVYLSSDVARDVQIQNFVDRTKGGHRKDFNHDVNRHLSFDLALRHLASKACPVVVETGTIRSEEDWAGAGFSTYLFGAFLHHHGGELHSVDFTRSKVAFAKTWTKDFPCVTIHESHSHEFLKAWNGSKIDLFYSDSADTEVPGHQENCLKEVQLAIPLLAENAKILIDDSPPNGAGGWQGKGGLAIPWLVSNGWKIEFSGWQALLRRSR